MSRHEDDVRLRDMLDAARKAVQAVQSRTRTDLDNDVLLGAALERFVEIVGEAASRVSPARQQATPQVPWRQIVGMRNRLIHGYASTDYDVLWDAVCEDLPALIVDLQRELGET